MPASFHVGTVEYQPSFICILVGRLAAALLKNVEDQMPLISVVLPIYDGLTHLPETIASILSQDVDFELVISDDRSRDGSLEYIGTLTDSRVRVLTNDSNAGIFGNLNRCIAVCRGDYIQVFSQDDVMQSGYLRSQIDLLIRYPAAGLVYGTPDYIDEAGNFVSDGQDDATPELISWGLYLWLSSHYGALPPSISSITVRRSTFDIVGLFNAEFRVAGDVEFYNRVAERFPIVRNKAILHSVRSHPQMMSALPTTGAHYLEEELILAEWYRKHWSEADYRQVAHFRSAARGRYHLGWIVKAALRGQLSKTLNAVLALNQIYPLRSILWWRMQGIIRGEISPYPVIAPPS